MTTNSNPSQLQHRPLLTIAYSTLADRVGNIVLPEQRSDREVLIIIQNLGGIALFDVPQRSDVRVLELQSRGVAKSRNEALRQAKGKYLIFADDDIIFKEAGLAAAVDYLELNPNVAFVLGQAVDEHGRLRKNYATAVTRLTHFNSAKAATYEMLVRVDASRSKNVWFDEDFGAGATNYLGDEYIFIVDLIKAGLRCVFLPATLAVHPAVSSGSIWGTERDLQARAIIFTRVFGIWSPFVRAAFGAKHLGRELNFKRYLRFIRG